MTPIWKQLVETWNDNDNENGILVAEVNCDDIRELTASPMNSLCLRHTVQTPMIKYGDPTSLGTLLQTYDKERTFEDLNELIEMNLIADRPDD